VALFFNRVVHQARARERSLEERGARDLRLDLLSGLSHDLKNPLGVIDQLVDLLLDGSAGTLGPQQADLARRIQTSARQVIVLSQNLIDAERIDAGRLEIQRRAASMTNVIGDALVVACNASEIKGVVLQASIEPGLPVVHVDAVQMERVIANLVGNAIKFTPAGGRVHVIVRHERDQLILSVSDTGPGIPADELPRLAERHFRGSGSRGVDGSGLGLFIVRAVVEAHGGQLRVASGGTCGTTVTVTLPIMPSEAHDRPNVETPPPPRMVATAGAVQAG